MVWGCDTSGSLELSSPVRAISAEPALATVTDGPGLASPAAADAGRLPEEGGQEDEEGRLADDTRVDGGKGSSVPPRARACVRARTCSQTYLTRVTILVTHLSYDDTAGGAVSFDAERFGPSLTEHFPSKTRHPTPRVGCWLL
jgi:hypothetical protein